MKRKRLLFLGTALLVGLAAAATGAFDFAPLKQSVTMTTLKNGLTVIVMERPDAPVASFVSWVNAGSAYDPKGYTGLAHMFEHMAFKGTTTLGSKDINKEKKLIAIEDSLFMRLRDEQNKGRFADSALVDSLYKAYEKAREDSYQLVDPNAFTKVIEREGGQGLNAYTAWDETVYFFSLPSNRVELWMALESERFLNPVLREMYKERDVIAEERRMRIDSDPTGRLFEEFVAMAYKAHPYGITGVGHMSDINYYSREEAAAFFNKYYIPANMVVAIVGDVKAPEVLKLAERYWGRIPARPKPPRIATVEPEQLAERRTVLEDPAQPMLFMGWHIPDALAPDRDAVEQLGNHLANGRTSILYKELVKNRKIAIETQMITDYPGDKYPGLAFLVVVPSAGHTAQECEQAVNEIIAKIRTEPVSPADMDKIKAQAKSDFIQGLNSNTGLGMQLAYYQTRFGNWQEMFNQLGRINALTADDLLKAAQTYLTDKNRTVAMLVTAES